MAYQSRVRKRVHALRRGPDGSAFQKWEEFMKTCKDENEFEIEKKGFEKWKTMSKEERLPFRLQADKVNSAYERMLRKEESEMQWVDDEADSAEVCKYDENYEDYEVYFDSESSDGFQFSLSDTHWSFYSEDSF